MLVDVDQEFGERADRAGLDSLERRSWRRLNEIRRRHDQQVRGNGAGMKRLAIFVLLGPPLATVILFLVLLPIAGLLEGQRIEISISPSAYLYCLFPALVIAVFDWITEMIELPYRPIATAIVGWILAFLVLREILALPDLPGWFVAIGLLGAVPAFVCSWVVLTTDKAQGVKA